LVREELEKWAGDVTIEVALSGQTDAAYAAISDETGQTRTVDGVRIDALDLVRIFQVLRLKAGSDARVGPLVHDAVM
jgi:hypothetical protein